MEKIMSSKIVKIFIIALGIAIASFYSCSEKSAAGTGLLDPNGLSKEINNIVPDSLLDKIKALGMPVNTGDAPPDIVGSYLIAPFILDSTNIGGDWPVGTAFADYHVNFTDQNNNELSVNIDYANGGELGNGIGSFIVGDASNFSVFSRITSHNPAQTDSAYVLFLFSGSKQADGLHNMYVAILMLDDLGDPSGYFIENGQGRIFYDQDELSEPIVWDFLKQSAINRSEKSKISALQQR